VLAKPRWPPSNAPKQTQGSITLYVTDDEFAKGSIRILKKTNTNILAQLTRIKNNQRLSTTFELEERQKVRIYSLGESDQSRLSDYGYITNIETQKLVWEMVHYRTHHAGGAKKNRLANRVIDWCIQA
jgi:hypothetical protein